MRVLFNAPPGWVVPPAGWLPSPGWVPDPSWPAAPAGWHFYLPHPVDALAQALHHRAQRLLVLGGLMVAVGLLLAGVTEATGGFGDDGLAAAVCGVLGACGLAQLACSAVVHARAGVRAQALVARRGMAVVAAPA